MSKIVILGDFCPTGNKVEGAMGSLLPFSEVQRLFGQEALLVVSLECPLTNHLDVMPGKWAALRANTTVAPLMKGVDVAVLANNHMCDFGIQGANDTVSALGSLGIKYCGYGKNVGEACQPLVVDLPPGKLGILNFCCPTTNGRNFATYASPGVAPLGMNLLVQSIRDAKSVCDAVLVYLHWGREWVHGPVPSMMRIARRAIDNGADAVVGCHSHTVQAYEQYKGRWIFYGLGNFLFGEVTVKEPAPDGTVEERPFFFAPTNRESLAVCFQMRRAEEPALVLERIQPFAQPSHLEDRPVPISALSVDIERLNRAVAAYAKKHACSLASSQEPQFVASMQANYLNITHNEQPISECAGLGARIRMFLSSWLSRLALRK